jgi:hypothetical protein
VSEKEPTAESQTSAFAKVWADSFAKLAQAALTFSPDAVPPEILRQVRSGMFQALAQSWDEFLRSPQFMEGMKQVMDNALAFRKLSMDFLAKAHQELGSVTSDDVEGLVSAIRQLESRLTERLNELSSQIVELNRRLDKLPAGPTATPAAPQPARRARSRSGDKAT